MNEEVVLPGKEAVYMSYLMAEMTSFTPIIPEVIRHALPLCIYYDNVKLKDSIIVGKYIGFHRISKIIHSNIPRQHGKRPPIM